jgi:hypothetical protein
VEPAKPTEAVPGNAGASDLFGDDDDLFSNAPAKATKKIEEGKAEKKATKMKEKKKLVKTDDAGVSFQLLNLGVAPFMVCLWYDI